MIVFFRKEHILLPVVILVIQSHSCYGFHTKNILSKNIISNIQRPPTQRTLQTFRTHQAERIFRTQELYLTEESEQLDVERSLLKSNNIDARTYVTMFGILPILSFLTFDQLLSQITDFNLAPADRQLWIIALLLSKRLYIYALALTTVDLAAKRSVDLPASLGQRLSTINGEIFDGIPLLDLNTPEPLQTTPQAAIARKEALKEREQLYATLDTIDDKTQAKLIPLLVAGSLLLSFLFLGITSTINQSQQIILDQDNQNIIQTILTEIQRNLGPYFLEFISSLTLFWNAAVCSLFSKSEIQAAFSNFLVAVKDYNRGKNGNIVDILTKNRIVLPFIVSLLISLVSFFSLPGSDAWPIQNILNICIAITVARAAQLPRLPYIVLALVGLVFYDVVSVVGTQQFTDGGASIMEAVARAKAGIETLPPLPPISSLPPTTSIDSLSSLSSLSLPLPTVDTLFTLPPPPPLPAVSLPPVPLPQSAPVLIPSLSSWRPGLFQVVVGRKVSDVLGLADVVFPAMLAGWGLRYDIANKILLQGEIEESRRIIENNSVMIDDQFDEKVEKISFFRRLKNYFWSKKVKNEDEDEWFRSKNDVNEINEISKEKEREQNIIAILEEEKIEILDKKIDTNLKNSVFSSSLIGYGFGCFLCEIFQTGEGQPALLYIVPSMFVSVFLTGLIRGDINSMWGYNPEETEVLAEEVIE